MDNELKQLNAPKRTQQTIEHSYEKIKAKAYTKRKMENWLHGSIIISAALLFLLLLIPPSERHFSDSTSASGTEILTIEAVPVDSFDKTFLIGRGHFLEEESQELFSQYVEEIKRHGEDNLGLIGEFFRVTYANGEIEHYKLYDPITLDGYFYTLTNLETKKSIKLSGEDYFTIGRNHPYFSRYQEPAYTARNFVIDCIKFAFILFVYSGYLILAKKASPLARQELHLEFTCKNMVLKLAFLLFVLIVVSSITYHEFHYHNWLIALYLMIGIFLLRKFKEYLDGNSRRKWREIPISIFFYMLCYLIFIF